MATKPIKLPEWASDGVTNVVEPTSGQKLTGWTTGQTGVSGFDNWVKLITFNWMQYLNDGALSGNHSIAGNLSVTGTFSANGNCTLGDAAGDAHTVNGTLGVTGLITASAGATVPTGQKLTYQGTADESHGDRVQLISPVASGNFDAGWAIVATGTGVVTTSFIQSSGGGGFLYIPLNFRTATRLKSVTFSLLGNGTTDITVTAKSLNAAGTESDFGTTTVNNQAASFSDTTLTLTPTTLGASQVAWLEFVANGSGLRVGTIRVTYDRP